MFGDSQLGLYLQPAVLFRHIDTYPIYQQKGEVFTEFISRKKGKMSASLLDKS